MTDDREERFARAIDAVRELRGDKAAEEILAARKAAGNGAAAELQEWALTTSFGFLMQRPGLSHRDRAIALFTADVANQYSLPAMKDHVLQALHVGVTPDELMELCYFLIWYCGMPAVREAQRVVAEAIEEYNSTAQA